MNQHTIDRAVSIAGKGIHTGAETTVTFKPADADAGIVFVRTDLPGNPSFRVTPQVAVADADETRRTVLRSGGAEVQTVEHVLATLLALRIDNVTIEIDGPEVPEPRDGSAQAFLELLQEAGLRDLRVPRRVLRVRRPVVYRQGDVYVTAYPEEGLRVSFTLQFENKVVGTQYLTVQVTPESFAREIAPARTFVLHKDVEALRARGLIKGGSLDNAIVVTDEGIMNEQPLRYEDEFVRHKILDFLGDLYLMGCPVEGHFHAVKSGHVHNVGFVKVLEEALRGAGQFDQLADEVHFDINQIESIMPHRFPFLLVDRILYLEERNRVVGIKNVTVGEPFFQGHFPGHPIMPAVLIIEAMAQVGGVLLLNTVDNPETKLVYFMGIDNARFRRPVLPGDQLVFDLRLLKLKSRTCKMSGKAYVRGKLVAEADLMSSIVEREARRG